MIALFPNLLRSRVTWMKVRAASAAGLLWLIAASPASASLTYYFSANNSTGGVYPSTQDYAKVTLTDVDDFTGSTDGVKIQLQMIIPPATGAWTFMQFGLNVETGTIAKTDAYFNFDSDNSFNESGTSEKAWYDDFVTSDRMDGFGVFEYSWGAGNGNSDRVPTVTFYIAGKRETDFQSPSTDGDSRYFSVHIDTNDGRAADTWFWGTSSEIPEEGPFVPEPASLVVWALLGVAGLCVARRRFSA